MSGPMFDQAAFARSIRIRMAERAIDGRTAAKEIGCSPSVVSRITHAGKAPNVETYLRVLRWLSPTPRPQPIRDEQER